MNNKRTESYGIVITSIVLLMLCLYLSGTPVNDEAGSHAPENYQLSRKKEAIIQQWYSENIPGPEYKINPVMLSGLN